MGLFSKKTKIEATDVDFEELKFFRVTDSKGIYEYSEELMHRVPVV